MNPEVTRVSLVWLLLLALTAATYAAGKAGLGGPLVMYALLLSIFIKGHFIIADFMGLRGAPRMWRWLVHGWLVLVMGAIALAYLMGLKT
ncbi:MAG: hypothetical protein DSZ32_07345 [Gammaproteobacteria bacterium]|nr:MAG: hypothetical protein DSZ32_07345 [Gammaproteobacteria bacterium]